VAVRRFTTAMGRRKKRTPRRVQVWQGLMFTVGQLKVPVGLLNNRPS